LLDNLCSYCYFFNAVLPIVVTFPSLCALHGLQVLDEPQVRALRMGLYLGVSQGSAEPLKLIHLTYTPDRPLQQVVRTRLCSEW
jgi:hypothetical protein